MRIYTLRERRLELGLTQAQLGQRCGTDNQTVSSWEQKATRPRPYMYQQLLEALELQPEELDLQPYVPGPRTYVRPRQDAAAEVA